jgi:hypothetical protein
VRLQLTSEEQRHARIDRLQQELKALQDVKTERARKRRETIARELIELAKADGQTSAEVSLRPKPDRRGPA